MTGPGPAPTPEPITLPPELAAFWGRQLPTLSPPWREAVLRRLTQRYGPEAVRDLMQHPQGQP